MTLLRADVDAAVIALWLGHSDIRSTQIYPHADLIGLPEFVGIFKYPATHHPW